MARSIRILLVDDYAPIRATIRSVLHRQPRLKVVDEAANGLDAVEKAHRLQPDLILLDVGLPMMNGIEAARRIRELSPDSKILFLSEMRSTSFAAEALRVGARGYIVKSDAATELMPGVEAVLGGGEFLSSSLATLDTDGPWGKKRFLDHVGGFYSEDSHLLEHVSQFVATTLKEGNAVVVLATEPHRNVLCQRLTEMGIHLAAEIRQGRYFAVDAEEALSLFMVGGMPDPDRFENAFRGLLEPAKKASRGPGRRVGVFGECVHLLCAQGNPEAAIRTEKLGNKLLEKHDLRILCGYVVSDLREKINGDTFQRIRDEHSVVHFH
jgi:CheY-like chemotaxis protein